MNAMPWVEKRRVHRLRSSLPTYYESTIEGKHGNGLTQDISESGLRMTLEEFIPKFARVLVKINLKSDKLVVLNGKVRWTQRVAYSPRYQVGLEFEDAAWDTRRSIAEYVYSRR